MKITILLALFAAVCAAPSSEEIFLDADEQEAFIAVLDLIKSVALITDVDASSEEREKAAVFTVLEKLRAAAESNDWDRFELEDDELPAFVGVMELIKMVGNNLEEMAGEETAASIRQVRSIMRR